MTDLEILTAFIQALGDPRPRPQTIEEKIAKLIDIANSPNASEFLKKVGSEYLECSKSAFSPNERNSYLIIGYACLGCAEELEVAERARTGG
jgi:hypothetical protein